MNVRRSVRSLARRAADGLVAVLAAPRCAACRRSLEAPLSGPICAACWDDVRLFTPPVCDRCGDELPSWRGISLRACLCPRCRRGTRSVSRSRAAGAYEGSLRAIVHALKYDGRRSVAPRLAAMLRVQGREVLDGSDCTVPVPLHWRRQRARGFNQAAELASHLGLPVCHALRRVRWTQPQIELPASRRHRNVRGAFALVRQSWWAPGQAFVRRSIRQRCVVLVDDVSTTGATLEACARVLKAAGAREVRTLTVARVAARRPTGPPQPRPASVARRQS